MLGFAKCKFEFFDVFWRCCPALLFATATLLGFAISFNGNLVFLLPVTLLWCPLISSKEKMNFLIAILFFCGAIWYGKTHYTFPSMEREGIYGKGVFSIENISSSHAYGTQLWTYQGTIKHFTHAEDRVIGRNLPCSIRWSGKGPRPLAHTTYHLEGLLKEIAPRYYTLTVRKPWKPLHYVSSIVEWRHAIKSSIREAIRDKIPHRTSGTFLAGLITGQFNDPYLAFEFSRFGLQHIMAISGFHFAIIALLLNALLRLVLPLSLTQFILLILLGGYFFLLGPRPSIVRAWLMITVGLCGFFTERHAISLNSLGVALLCVLFYHPLHCLHLGFQFSFGITAMILLYTQPCYEWLKKLIPFRHSNRVFRMPLWDQHGYLLLSLFRHALALTGAVNLFTLPLVLFYFHQFPLISLIYNLFYPFLVGISILLLALSFLILPLPAVSTALFHLTSHFTNSLINLTYHLPLSADYMWYIKDVPLEILIVFFSLIFLIGIRIFATKVNPLKYIYF